MFKLFLMNFKQNKKRKNFVKNKKHQSDSERIIGLKHRLTNNDLHAVYQSSSDMYQDCLPNESEFVNAEFRKKRLTNETLQKGD